MTKIIRAATWIVLLLCATPIFARDVEAHERSVGRPPSGFVSANAEVDGARIRYVRGGQGPALILVHGFPQDWVEYRAIMPRLAQRFTVVAVDLPGIGESAPAIDGYQATNLAADIATLAESLHLDHPYLVGHDLGGIVTYAYVRRFPNALRGAMILDVPVPGIAGWDQAVSGMWHIGFIQTPDLPEKLVTGRQSAFLGHMLDVANFTSQERAYYFDRYGAAQLHAAFEIYRGFPADAAWNAAQTVPNAVPLTVAVGEKSFFAPMLQTFVNGYRAKGMAHVESAQIAGASHYVVADNPEAVADLIGQHAGIENR